MLCVHMYVCLSVRESVCVWVCSHVHIFGLYLCLISSSLSLMPLCPPALPTLFCAAAYHPKAWAWDLAPCQTGLHENRQCSRPRVSELCFSMYVLCSNILFGFFFVLELLSVFLLVHFELCYQLLTRHFSVYSQYSIRCFPYTHFTWAGCPSIFSHPFFFCLSKRTTPSVIH